MHHAYVEFLEHLLGCFDSEIDAAKRYNRAAKMAWGQFANLNPV